MRLSTPTPDRHENCKHQGAKIVKYAQFLQNRSTKFKPDSSKVFTPIIRHRKILTFEASQVLFNRQYLHSWSHCGHITILPPISGSHTSLLANTRRQAPHRNELAVEMKTEQRSTVPPRAGFLCFVPVYETTETHNSGQGQHDGVEAQPGEVNSNFLAVVLPVK